MFYVPRQPTCQSLGVVLMIPPRGPAGVVVVCVHPDTCLSTQPLDVCVLEMPVHRGGLACWTLRKAGMRAMMFVLTLSRRPAHPIS